MHACGSTSVHQGKKPCADVLGEVCIGMVCARARGHLPQEVAQRTKVCMCARQVSHAWNEVGQGVDRANGVMKKVTLCLTTNLLLIEYGDMLLGNDLIEATKEGVDLLLDRIGHLVSCHQPHELLLVCVIHTDVPSVWLQVNDIVFPQVVRLYAECEVQCVHIVLQQPTKLLVVVW